MFGYLVRGVAALLLWSYVLGLLGYLILRLVVGCWQGCYNRKRLHSTLAYLTLDQVE